MRSLGKRAKNKNQKTERKGKKKLAKKRDVLS